MGGLRRYQLAAFAVVIFLVTALIYRVELPAHGTDVQQGSRDRQRLGDIDDSFTRTRAAGSVCSISTCVIVSEN